MERLTFSAFRDWSLDRERRYPAPSRTPVYEPDVRHEPRWHPVEDEVLKPHPREE